MKYPTWFDWGLYTGYTAGFVVSILGYGESPWIWPGAALIIFGARHSGWNAPNEREE